MDSVKEEPSTREMVISVLLRTPGIFLVDYWFRWQKDASPASSPSVLDTTLHHGLFAYGLSLLLLPVSLIRTIYSLMIYLILFVAFHLISCYYLEVSPEPAPLPIDPILESMSHHIPPTITTHHIVVVSSPLIDLLSSLLFHVILATTVLYAIQGWGTRRQISFLLILGCYSLPVMARLAHLRADFLHPLHSFTSILVALTLIKYLVTSSLPKVLSSVRNSLYPTLLSIQSIQQVPDLLVASIISLVSRILFPPQFMLFWIITFGYKLWTITQSGLPHPSDYVSNLKGDFSDTSFLLLYVAAEVITTPVSLVSSTIAIKYGSSLVLKGIGKFLSSVGERGPHHQMAHPIPQRNNGTEEVVVNDGAVPNLQGRNNVIPRNSLNGWEEGVTALLLSLLTGIMDMKQSARMAVLVIILFIVLTSLLQAMLHIAEPVVLSLSAHHGRNFFHHLKVLFLCSFLFFFPLQITYLLSTLFPVDFWMAVVLSSSALTSVQVLDMVSVHCLLWYDATRSTPWDPLDEVVYYVRGVTKCIEFVIAFSVVVMGVYEGLTGEWTYMNSFIIVVHFYYNVYQRLHSGAKSFFMRRKAVQRSAGLPAPSPEQLDENKDVCSICYMDQETAIRSVVTPCNHLFHRVCLRRWLSFQDRCPLCNSPIIKDDTPLPPPSVPSPPLPPLPPSSDSSSFSTSPSPLSPSTSSNEDVKICNHQREQSVPH